MAILFYHAGALGDFITALPAMRTYRSRRAGAPAVLLGRPEHGPLAAMAGAADETWDAANPRFASLYAGSPDPALAAAFSRFDSALLFASGASRLPAGLRAAGARGITVQEPFPSGRTPIVEHHLSLFPDAGPGDRSVSFAYREDVVRRSRLLMGEGERPVAIHPGSGGPRKMWPLGRFADLASRLSEAGRAVAWIAGPAEETLALPRGGLHWKNEGLAVLAHLLSRSALFVGNDSGVAHLAAAAGCPVVALFGASDPIVWAPNGRKVRVVAAAGGMESIDVDEVYDACVAMLENQGR